MRMKHSALVFRMELRADKPTERWNLDNLHQVRLRIAAYALHAMRLKLVEKTIVELVAMAMALAHQRGAIDSGHPRVGLQLAIVGAKAHRSSQIGDVLLILHQVDHVVLRLSIHLAAVSIGIAKHVASELYDHHLHTQTNSQTGHIVRARIFHGKDLSLDATLSEAGANHQAILPIELLRQVLGQEKLGVDKADHDLAMVVGGRMRKTLKNRLVGILQVVLAHQTNMHLTRSRLAQVEEAQP